MNIKGDERYPELAVQDIFFAYFEFFEKILNFSE